MSATTIALFSLGVAVVGAVTAITSLMWQVATRARGTHRVAVQARFAWVADRDFGDDETYVAIEVVNKGLSPVQIRSYGVETPDGKTVIALRPFLGAPTLPHLLHGGTSSTFYLPSTLIIKQIGDLDRRQLRAAVDLATGQRKKGKRGELKTLDG